MGIGPVKGDTASTRNLDSSCGKTSTAISQVELCSVYLKVSHFRKKLKALTRSYLQTHSLPSMSLNRFHSRSFRATEVLSRSRCDLDRAVDTFFSLYSYSKMMIIYFYAIMYTIHVIPSNAESAHSRSRRKKPL